MKGSIKAAVGTEIRKSFRSSGLYISLLFGLIICVLQTVWVYKNIYMVNNSELEYVMSLPVTDENYGSWFETCIMQGWLGCEIYSCYNALFFIVLPLIAVLPYGISLFLECRSGYAAQMVVRCGRKPYILGKAVAVFLSGGTAAVFPLILSLLVSACYLPAVGIDPISMQSVVANKDMWSFFFFDMPVVYALLYSVVVFVYGGIFALISMLCCEWFENGFGIMIFPLLLHCMMFYGVNSLLPASAEFNPSVFINPSQPVYTNTVFGILVTTVVLIATETVILIFTHRRKDYY